MLLLEINIKLVKIKPQQQQFNVEQLQTTFLIFKSKLFFGIPLLQFFLKQSLGMVLFIQLLFQLPLGEQLDLLFFKLQLYKKFQLMQLFM